MNTKYNPNHYPMLLLTCTCHKSKVKSICTIPERMCSKAKRLLKNKNFFKLNKGEPMLKEIIFYAYFYHSK